jgi:cellulose synthase/poly-beta-1,6-N-acetylglucosamine synthase-like glycosyltransferase
LQVTEGKGSQKDHILIALVCVILLAGGAVLGTAYPPAGEYILWAVLVLAGGTVLRSLALSILAGLLHPRPAPPTEKRPAIAFVIPGLNELPSLKRTVPAMMALRYDGELHFCYVLEAASTDGSADYVRECTAKDPRVVPIDKSTPPGGRGAAVAYGVARTPECDVVGFLDADHEMDQASFDELVRVFGQDEPPPAIQGVCDTTGGEGNPLVRLLTVERSWLESLEVEVNPRLGGVSLFGGGQGFFQRGLLMQEGHQIDESMILDDIDLCCRLAVEGYRIRFDRALATWSTQPETLAEFVDQRFRWARGWVQLAGKYLWRLVSGRGIRFGARMDLLRLLLMPYAAGFLFFGFGVGAGLLATTASHTLPVWLTSFGMLWPVLVCFHPLLAGRGGIRLRDVPLLIVGVPLLFYVYTGLCAVSVVDAWLLRRPLSYAKTAKHG